MNNIDLKYCYSFNNSSYWKFPRTCDLVIDQCNWFCIWSLENWWISFLMTTWKRLDEVEICDKKGAKVLELNRFFSSYTFLNFEYFKYLFTIKIETHWKRLEMGKLLQSPFGTVRPLFNSDFHHTFSSDIVVEKWSAVSVTTAFVLFYMYQLYRCFGGEYDNFLYKISVNFT